MSETFVTPTDSNRHAVSPKPGEVVVISVPLKIPSVVKDAIRKEIEAAFGVGSRCVVLDGGLTLELAGDGAAVRQEREACAAMVEGFKTASPDGSVSYWGEALAAAIRARGD